jgi:hypothetical protein
MAMPRSVLCVTARLCHLQLAKRPGRYTPSFLRLKRLAYGKKRARRCDAPFHLYGALH